jgi:hypothetical protein
VYAVALLLAPTADASRFIRIGIYDDAEILYGIPDFVFPVLKQVNTKLIRANLKWGGPNGVANTKPANPSDPSDPAYDWSTYDRTVLRARGIGAEVMLAIVGTPPWANSGKGWNTAPSRAIDLRRFAVAAARRYNGSFVGPDGRLPAVRLWIAWNEPNNPVFLQPQYARVGSRWVLRSARDYARICNSIVAGVRSVQSNARVACGVTAPRGNNNPTSSRPSSAPIAFLRGMRSAGAKGFQAYAHHPYYGTRNETPSTPPPPGRRGQAATAITLGNFQLLTREVQRLYGNVRIWVTEYGYQTNPPDRLFGVTYPEQANYMREAYRKLKRNPKVDVFVWFLLRDEARLGGWQSGIYNRRYLRKDARAVFEQISTGRKR